MRDFGFGSAKWRARCGVSMAWHGMATSSGVVRIDWFKKLFFLEGFASSCIIAMARR